MFFPREAGNEPWAIGGPLGRLPRLRAGGDWLSGDGNEPWGGVKGSVID